MSTLRVSNLQNEASANNQITLGTDGFAQINGVALPTAGPLSSRNLVVNGAMAVAQRGTSVGSGGYQTIDRFPSYFVNGAITQSQETLTSGTPYNEGFRYFFRLANTTAVTGAAGDLRSIWTNLEAQNLAQSGWNYTSSTSYVTVSFWVRASVEQEYYGYFRTQDGTAQVYPFSLGTLTADTWTKITKTVPGNSNVAFDNDNGEGLSFVVTPYMGADFTDSGVSVNTWAAYASGSRTPDQTSTWATTTGATFDITGVQLEVGSVATPFEHRSYGDELLRCQRYYWQTPTGVSGNPVFTGFANTTTNSIILTVNPVPMRAAPSFSSVSDWQIIDGTAFTVSSFTFQQATELTGRLDCTCTGLTTSRPNILRNNNTTATLQFSAEL